MIDKHELDDIHSSVPVDYYSRSIRENLLQRYWHTTRFRFTAQRIRELKPDGPVLDIGCHSGDFTSVVAQASGQPTTGLDISSQAVEAARSRFPKITFLQLDFPAHAPFPDSHFSLVTAFDVIEHIPDLAGVTTQVKRVLRPGGAFVVAVPSESLLFKAVWFFWERLKGHVWHDAHVHKFHSKDFSVFERAGFVREQEVTIMFGMWRFLVFRKPAGEPTHGV